MRASIPQGSKDSSNAGRSVWTEMETMFENKSVLALAGNRIMVGSELFSPPSYLADKFIILKFSKDHNS